MPTTIKEARKETATTPMNKVKKANILPILYELGISANMPSEYPLRNVFVGASNSVKAVKDIVLIFMLLKSIIYPPKICTRLVSVYDSALVETACLTVKFICSRKH